jgi:hypothetical protein
LAGRTRRRAARLGAQRRNPIGKGSGDRGGTGGNWSDGRRARPGRWGGDRAGMDGHCSDRRRSWSRGRGNFGSAMLR